MTTDPLHLVTWVALAAVLVRHMAGANRAFRRAPGERPSLLTQVIGAAAVVILVSIAEAPLTATGVGVGLALLTASLVVFEWAKRSIRGQFFSYIYSEDLPQFLWTQGPYAYVRNPFYDSYLLAYLAAAIMVPGLMTLGVLVVMSIYFWSAARFEEGKFARSAVAAEYDKYRRRTGRFLPRLR
jgi:protein-S-isoprenylcysteine O-methyltransferase Ste14